MIRRPPRPPLFPYTPLFRSRPPRLSTRAASPSTRSSGATGSTRTTAVATASSAARLELVGDAPRAVFHLGGERRAIRGQALAKRRVAHRENLRGEDGGVGRPPAPDPDRRHRDASRHPPDPEQRVHAAARRG